jgi:hypothetical protein
MTDPNPTRPSSATPVLSTRAVAGTSPIFHPERLVAVLGRFRVKYVLIGGVAARLHGVPWMTSIADIAPELSDENLTALAQALRHLGARVFTAATPLGVEVDLTPETLRRAGTTELITSCGRLNVAVNPGNTRGFGEIAPGAVRFQLHGDTIMVADLDALAQIKSAESSVVSSVELALLRAMIERRDNNANTH